MNLKTKQWAYRKTFLGDDGKPHEAAKVVLDDLVRFTRLNETCDIDPEHSFGMEKARMSVRRILNFLKVDYMDSYDLQIPENIDD